MQSMVRGGVGHRHTIPTLAALAALTALVVLVGAVLLSTPASAAASSGCDPVVVHTPTSSEGDASAVTIDSQVLGAGGSAWERVSWTVADDTALSAVEVVSPDGETVTRTGDISVGFEEDVAELRFCAAASGTGPAGSDDADDSPRPADRGDEDPPERDGAEAGDDQGTPGGGSDGQDGRAGQDDDGTASSGQPAGDERPDEPSGSAADDPSQPASDGVGTAAQDDGTEAGEPDPDEAADQRASAADAGSTEPADGETDAQGQAAGQPAGAESGDSAALPLLAIGLLLGTAVLLAVAWRQRSA